MDIDKLYDDYTYIISNTKENWNKLLAIREDILEFINKIPSELVNEFYKVLFKRTEFEIYRAKGFGEYLIKKFCK